MVKIVNFVNGKMQLSTFYIVCNYLVCDKVPDSMYVKKKLCSEWDFNCCTSAWRSVLLPTGLLGSVNTTQRKFPDFTVS